MLVIIDLVLEKCAFYVSPLSNLWKKRLYIAAAAECVVLRTVKTIIRI